MVKVLRAESVPSGMLWCPDCRNLVVPQIDCGPTDEGSQQIAMGADPENVSWEIRSAGCPNCGGLLNPEG
jgi:hypothetical protein